MKKNKMQHYPEDIHNLEENKN
jgi:hypothetical protein